MTMQDLLFLAHRIPYPPNKGDKLRSYHLLKCLTERFRVHLGCFVDADEDWAHVERVRKICTGAYFAGLSPTRGRMRALSSLLRDEPLTLGYYRDPELHRWVRTTLEHYPVKRVLVFSGAMAQYVSDLDDTVRVMDMVDVDSAKWEQLGQTKSWPLSWLYQREGRTLRDFEATVANAFDATVFVSAAEAALFRQRSGVTERPVLHAANGVDSEYFAPDVGCECPFNPSEKAIVFTGAMDYWPNVDAVRWFAGEVFPLIRARWPETRFVIVGARPTEDVLKLAEMDGVSVTGTVPDVRPYVKHALVVVAPLRVARGVQNKVLEGMAMGKTVIASPGAAEGIDAAAGRDLAIAHSAEDYVSQIGAVMEGRLSLGVAARNRILRAYSWEQNLETVVSLLNH